MGIENLSSEDNRKLRHVIDTAVANHTQISDLRGATNDMIKAAAEDLGLNPKAVKAAIKAAIKDDLEEQKILAEETETILMATGRG